MDPMDGGEDGFARRVHVPTGIRRQQGGGGVMFWAAIIGNELIGPFRVADGVKMTAKLYVDFTKEHLVPWHKKKKL